MTWHDACRYTLSLMVTPVPPLAVPGPVMTDGEVHRQPGQALELVLGDLGAIVGAEDGCEPGHRYATDGG